jgi:hypothetical protein
MTVRAREAASTITAAVATPPPMPSSLCVSGVSDDLLLCPLVLELHREAYLRRTSCRVHKCFDSIDILLVGSSSY